MSTLSFTEKGATLLKVNREKSRHDPWWVKPAMVVGFLATSLAIVFGLNLLIPTSDAHFDACMARAERVGLSEAAHDQAVLICLRN